MNEAGTGRIRTEIGHVVFVDIVGFTRMQIEEQTRAVSSLQDAILGSPEYVRALAAGEVYSLDTGDGAAIVFFGDPIAAAQFSVELRLASRLESSYKLRIGINSGPVARMTDLTGKPNVTGSGINIAQRIMDCASPGQVLLSETYADFLGPFEDWSGRIQMVGEFTTKHNMTLRLCELHIAPSEPEFADQTARLRFSKTPRISIIYKRNTAPDDELLAFLERELAARGASVFIDRHLSVGVEWAIEIEKQIRGSDAVVALISSKSAGSEMLEYEIRTSLDEFEKSGKPRILPIRVQFTDKVPGELGTILDRFHYIVWSGPEDNRMVADSLVRSIEESGRPAKPQFNLETPGGAMNAQSPFYVERPTDRRFLEAVSQQDSIVLVKGARQMGKTSLLGRAIGEVTRSGGKVVLTDFQVFNESQLSTIESFYKSLMHQIAYQLRLRINLDEIWSEHLGPNMNFEQFMECEILEKISQPLVWAMDEVDRLFTRPYSSEVFGLFRSWHNRRQLEPHGPWSKFTMAIAYATEAHLFITDLHQSPFNVGTRLELSDFTSEQVSELNKLYGKPLGDEQMLERFYNLLGGQPYLVRRGLDEMVRGSLTLEDLENMADKDEGPFGDHLRRILVSISNAPGLESAVRSILSSDACPDEESFYRLRTAGLVVGQSSASSRMRCILYKAYLERHLPR